MNSADDAVARRPSVYLSVTRRYSVKTVTHILKTLLTIGLPHHSSFCTPNGGWQYSDGTPLMGFISEVIQDRAIVTTEGE